LQLRQLSIAAHQRTLTRLGRWRALGHDAVMRDRFLDALHQCSRAGLQLKVVAYQHLHGLGDHHCARWSQARDAGSQVGGQPVHVVFGGVQIHQPAVHPHPDVDLDPKAALRLVAEPGHLPGDFKSGVHRASHVVLVGDWVAEHRQQSVTLGGADVPFVSVHGAQDLLAIAADQEPIRFGLYPSRQHRGIHQIGEENRQPPDLTRIARRDQQVLGLGVRAVNSQHLPRQGCRGGTITAVDRRNRPIQQLINRRRTSRAGIAISPRALPTVAHLDIVASPLDAVCCIAQAIIHGNGDNRRPGAGDYPRSRFGILDSSESLGV
jgi:hypothetical protein